MRIVRLSAFIAAACFSLAACASHPRPDGPPPPPPHAHGDRQPPPPPPEDMPPPPPPPAVPTQNP